MTISLAIAANTRTKQIVRGIAEETGLKLTATQFNNIIGYLNKRAYDGDTKVLDWVSNTSTLVASTEVASKTGYKKYSLTPLLWITGADLILEAVDAFNDGYTNGAPVDVYESSGLYVENGQNYQVMAEGLSNDFYIFTWTNGDSVPYEYNNSSLRINNPGAWKSYRYYPDTGNITYTTSGSSASTTVILSYYKIGSFALAGAPKVVSKNVNSDDYYDYSKTNISTTTKTNYDNDTYITSLSSITYQASLELPDDMSDTLTSDMTSLWNTEDSVLTSGSFYNSGPVRYQTQLRPEQVFIETTKSLKERLIELDTFRAPVDDEASLPIENVKPFERRFVKGLGKDFIFDDASGQWKALQVDVPEVDLTPLETRVTDVEGSVTTLDSRLIAVEGTTVDTSGLIPKVVQEINDIPLVPNMTSNTSPSPYVVSASSYYNSNTMPWEAFTNTSSTAWYSGNYKISGEWLQIDFSEEKRVVKYSLTPGSMTSPSGMPGAWDIEASNDNINWTVIDSREGITWDSPEIRYFSVNYVTSKRYYRIKVKSNSTSSDYIVIANIQYYDGPLQIENKIPYITTEGLIRASEFSVNKLSNYEARISTLESAEPAPTITYDTGNFEISYTYDEAGKIESETIVGDITRTTAYTYYPVGDPLEGKIQTETIVENGKTIAKTFSYDATTGKITGVGVTTTTT